MTAADVDRMKLVIERQGQVAALRAQWIKDCGERIAATVEAMTPCFYIIIRHVQVKSHQFKRFRLATDSAIAALCNPEA